MCTNSVSCVPTIYNPGIFLSTTFFPGTSEPFFSTLLAASPLPYCLQTRCDRRFHSYPGDSDERDTYHGGVRVRDVHCRAYCHNNGDVRGGPCFACARNTARRRQYDNPSTGPEQLQLSGAYHEAFGTGLNPSFAASTRSEITPSIQLLPQRNPSNCFSLTFFATALPTRWRSAMYSTESSI